MILEQSIIYRGYCRLAEAAASSCIVRVVGVSLKHSSILSIIQREKADYSVPPPDLEKLKGLMEESKTVFEKKALKAQLSQTDSLAASHRGSAKQARVKLPRVLEASFFVEQIRMWKDCEIDDSND